MMVLRDRGRRETEIETEKVIERKKRNLIELKKKNSITAAPQWVIHKCSLLQKKVQISNKLWKCKET